jgi:invasion protein IalB
MRRSEEGRSARGRRFKKFGLDRALPHFRGEMAARLLPEACRSSVTGGIMARFIAPTTALVATMAVIRIATASDRVDLPLAAPSHWMKSCSDERESQSRASCHTGAEVWNRMDGKVLASVEIIDRRDQGRNTLRVTFPQGVQLEYGTQLIVDDKPLRRSSFVGCSKQGCVSDYDIDAETMNSIKAGGRLVVQAVSQSGTPLTATLPLTGFAEAHDGPPLSEAEIEMERQRSHRWLDDRRWPVKR